MKTEIKLVKWGVTAALAVLLFFAAPVFAAAVAVEVQGDGYVDSYPSGILCGAACKETYSDYTRLTLTAHPNEGATFVKWGGCDTFTSTTCTVDLNVNREVVATFSGEVKKEYVLRVYRSGTPGVVQTNPFAIYCGSICVYDEAKFEAGSTVQVIASPGQGYGFAGWSGDCSGASPTCTLTIDSAKTVTASFGEANNSANSNTNALTVQKTGQGAGTVTSSDKRINCGTACTTNYNNGDSTVLTAVGSPGSTFARWGGACSGTRNTCAVTLDSAKTAIAEFSSTVYTYKLQISTSTTPKGGGRVVSPDGKADCQGCSVQFPENSNVTLAAVPSSDFVVFDSWTGDFCDGLKQPSCTFAMPPVPKAIHANFKALYTLSVETRGPGLGVVKSPDNLIDCGTVCSAIRLEGTEIVLEAKPERKAVFTGWEGTCSQAGKPTECTIALNADKKIAATFDHYMLPLIVKKTGPGTIISEDKKVDCGSSCATKYILDSKIRLRQIPGPNSRFKMIPAS